VLGEWLAHRPLARECCHARGLGRGHLSQEFVFTGRGLQFLELQLHLVQQTHRPLGALTVELTPQLLDLQLHMRDQCLVVGELGLRRRRHSLGGNPFRALGDQCRLQGVDVVRQHVGRDRHAIDCATSPLSRLVVSAG
jgi:hypothetical protein